MTREDIEQRIAWWEAGRSRVLALKGGFRSDEWLIHSQLLFAEAIDARLRLAQAVIDGLRVQLDRYDWPSASVKSLSPSSRWWHSHPFRPTAAEGLMAVRDVG